MIALFRKQRQTKGVFYSCIALAFAVLILLVVYNPLRQLFKPLQTTSDVLDLNSPFAARNKITGLQPWPLAPDINTHGSSTSRTVYLCVENRGRIGNALFTYLSALGIARANNLTVVYKDKSALGKVIKNPPRTDPDFEKKCAGAKILEQQCCAFNKNLMKLKRDVSAYYVGKCLISWVYFKDLENELGTILEFWPDVLAKAQAIVSDMRKRTNATLVGLHVRRADQKAEAMLKEGRKPIRVEYIDRAMQYFQQRFNPVHFVVASDDPKWCQEFIARDRKDVTLMTKNSAEVDILALTMTDHMIITIGTFGWWAGYFNPGIKTYMEDFILPDSAFLKAFSSIHPTDYVYPGWIPL